MAFLIKNMKNRPQAGVSAGYSALFQFDYVVRAAAATPLNATPEILFRVFGGRIIVHWLFSTVTTVIGAGATTLKYSHQELTDAGATAGTAVDLTAASASTATREVGATHVALGSGAAGIINNRGAILSTLGRNTFIVPQGQLYMTSAGADTTGAWKHEILFQALDPGAYVVAQAGGTGIIS